MPDDAPDSKQTDTPVQDEPEPRPPVGDTDAWGKPATGGEGAPEEEAAGWKAATEANRKDE